MTACSGKSRACEGGPVLPFKDSLDRHHTVVLMCSEDAEALNALGMDWVFTERRTSTPLIPTVLVERRRRLEAAA